MQNASHSRHKPWDGEAAAIDTSDGTRATTRATQAGRRKVRRKYPSAFLTATFLATAGLGAGVLIYPDRAANVLRKQEWMMPSVAWSTVFPERSAPTSTTVRADPPVSMRTWPQEAGRPAPPGPVMVNATLTNVAVGHPASTASVAATKPGQRELMWLPETEKAETPSAADAASAAKTAAAPPNTPAATPRTTAAAPPKVAVAPPEVAPVSNPVAPAAPAPSNAEVAELLKRARAQVGVGDITGARLLLQRAASGREPSALMALAETYDPAMLARWGSRGIKGDAAKARELYQAAAESGVAEARARVLAVR